MHERVIVITLDSEFLLDREVMDLVQLQQLYQHWVRNSLDGVVSVRSYFHSSGSLFFCKSCGLRFLLCESLLVLGFRISILDVKYK